MRFKNLIHRFLIELACTVKTVLSTAVDITLSTSRGPTGKAIPYEHNTV